jgi:hypothetical protein
VLVLIDPDYWTLASVAVSATIVVTHMTILRDVIKSTLQNRA